MDTVKFERMLNFRNVNGASLRQMIRMYHDERFPEENVEQLTKEYIDDLYENFCKNA